YSAPCASWLLGPDAARRRARARCDRRAQPLLQRLLRGSDGVGALRPGCARGEGARGAGRVIEGLRRVLVLAPHTDDGEFGCGGTMARLVEGGADVRYVAFSIATR